MSTTTVLYAESRRRLLGLQRQLQELESGVHSPELVSSTTANLNKLGKEVEELKVSATKTRQKGIWVKRAEELGKEYQCLRTALEKALSYANTLKREQLERQALFDRDRDVPEMGEIEGYAAEEASLKRSHNRMDEITDVGKAVLDSLFSQRQRLKGARKKLLDLTNILGLSNSLMGVIQRRTWSDKLLVYGGMVVTLIVLALCWMYLR